MPTKDRANLIKKSIESIIKQTNQDWELLVIDDHGTDDTEQIIKSYKNPKIKYIKLRGRGTGPAFARDYAIRKIARGEIIVITDSDDINYPNRLQLIYDYCQKNPDADVIYGNSDVLKENGETYPHPTPDFNKELLKKYNFIINPAASFKRSAYLRTAGYDENLRTSEDYDLWLAFLDNNCKFGFIKKSLVLRVIHKDRISSLTDYLKKKENLAYTRKKHHLTIPTKEDVKRLTTKKLWDYIAGGSGLDFWFSA